MNWNIVALFLAGTVVGVLSLNCKDDTHCLPVNNIPQCCVALNLYQLVGDGVCKPVSRFGQPCGVKSTEHKKNLYYCGCAPDTLECRVNPRYANYPNNERFMRCYPPAWFGADLMDDDMEVNNGPGEPPRDDDTEVKNGQGGEPPRDDDCEDWEKPC